MRAFLGTLAVVLAVAAAGPHPAVAAAGQASNAAAAAEQARLEAGDDLSSRARRALFRARARQDAGDFAEAASIIERWLAGDPQRNHHLLRFNLAVSLLAADRPAEALANLEQAVALAPRYARAWLRLGEAAYALEKYGRAGAAFERAYDLSPDPQPEILYYAGVSLLSGGQAPAAVDVLARLLDEHGIEAAVDWYRALAAAAAAAGQMSRAAPYLDRLLAARPDEPRVWDLAYRFYAGQSDYERAASLLTIGDYLQGLDRADLAQLGDLYRAIGVPLQAARYYERAYAGAPEPKPEEYRKLAAAWLAAHESGRARAVLARALAAGPTTALYALQGDLEYTDGNYPAALAAFRAATAQDAAFGRGYLMMGYCALETGDTTAAAEYLAKAAAFPDQADAAQELIKSLARPAATD